MPCIDASCIRICYTIGESCSALVDEKGVGREVPNEQIFCNRSEHIYVE